MKNINGLLLLALLFIVDVSCNDSILSKFFQNNYKLKDFRVELVRYNPKYYNFHEIKTFKYNRTTPAINNTFNLKISVGNKTEVMLTGYDYQFFSDNFKQMIVVQVQKFLSNEYRHFPIRFQVNLQKVFNYNAMGMKNIRNCGNITTFSFEKDITYHACNFIIDETRFPPLMPDGRYRVDLQYLYLNEEMAFIYGYSEVYTPIAYPKN